MTEVARLLESVSAATRGGAGFALVGGFAISARTEPRFTRDVDVAIAATSDAEAEATVRRFRDNGLTVIAVVEQEATGRMATVRLVDELGGQIDALFASSGIEPEIVGAAEVLEVLPGLVVPVATVGHLMAMKLLAEADARPTDRADLLALADVATDDDLAAARRAVGLIVERGYARDRDLLSALDALVDQA